MLSSYRAGLLRGVELHDKVWETLRCMTKKSTDKPTTHTSSLSPVAGTTNAMAGLPLTVKLEASLSMKFVSLCSLVDALRYLPTKLDGLHSLNAF